MDIGTRLELFLDRRMIESMSGTDLVLHEPRPAGRAIAFDLPWEGKYSAYPTILHGSNGYQLYYRGEAEAGPDGNSAEVTCYAESTDGLHWTKPNLGLFEVGGTRRNNVIAAHEPPFSHNFSPFIDVRGTFHRRKIQGVGGSGDERVACFCFGGWCAMAAMEERTGFS